MTYWIWKVILLCYIQQSLFKDLKKMLFNLQNWFVLKNKMVFQIYQIVLAFFSVTLSQVARTPGSVRVVSRLCWPLFLSVWDGAWLWRYLVAFLYHHGPDGLVGAVLLQMVSGQVYVEHMSCIWFVSDVRLHASASNYHLAMPPHICRSWPFTIAHRWRFLCWLPKMERLVTWRWPFWLADSRVSRQTT